MISFTKSHNGVQQAIRQHALDNATISSVREPSAVDLDVENAYTNDLFMLPKTISCYDG